MVSTAEGKGPLFVRYFAPVIEALNSLGGSGNPNEVLTWVASHLAISDKELSEQNASGPSRFYNQVAWARFYLSRAGLLDSSRRGIWSLTEKGRATKLSHASALEIFKEVQRRHAADRKAKQ